MKHWNCTNTNNTQMFLIFVRQNHNRMGQTNLNWYYVMPQIYIFGWGIYRGPLNYYPTPGPKKNQKAHFFFTFAFDFGGAGVGGAVVPENSSQGEEIVDIAYRIRWWVIWLIYGWINRWTQWIYRYKIDTRVVTIHCYCLCSYSFSLCLHWILV